MALAMARPWKHPKTGIYWLRRGVPAELRNAVGKREEKTSLKTRDPAEAKRLHAIAMVALEERWANLRTPARRFENGELHDITVLAYKACLRERNTPGIDWDISLAEDLWTDTYESVLSLAPELMRGSTGKQYHRLWCQQRADEYLASVGISPEDEDRLKVAKAIGLGAHKAITALQRQAQGDFRADAFLMGENVAHGSTSPSPAKVVPFKSLLDGWAAEKSPASKTLYSWERVLDQLSGFVGHDDGGRLTPEDLLRWKAALLEQGLRTKTIRDSKIAPLRAILQWGVLNRKLPSNPASQIQIDVRGKMTERIRGFTEDEAVLILQHAAKETDPVRRWIPLLCAYSGARLSEVCQLRKQDVFEHEGIWCMKFVPEAGSLKNASSERVVPLHPAVLKAGFPDFVASGRAGPLFSMLGADRFGNRGGTGTKAISRWVRAIGITDERISPSHSWRHRFKTLGRRHGLMTDIVNAMTGHHRKTVADAYGEFPMAALNRELLRIPTVGP